MLFLERNFLIRLRLGCVWGCGRGCGWGWSINKYLIINFNYFGINIYVIEIAIYIPRGELILKYIYIPIRYQ